MSRCIFALPALAVAFLLLANLGEGSRDEAARDDASKGSQKAILHHSNLVTTAAGSSTQASQTLLAVGAKATLKKTAKKAKARPPSDSELADGYDADSAGERGFSEDLSDANDAREEPLQDALEAPVLCHIASDIAPSEALAKIEQCVSQLEKIKEGTLEQGKTSWSHNNDYVRALVGLQSKMTELSRPEPFEIAFAVDQANMYKKLKDRLSAIQLDLPQLEKSGNSSSVPNMNVSEPEDAGEEDAGSGEEDAGDQDPA